LATNFPLKPQLKHYQQVTCKQVSSHPPPTASIISHTSSESLFLEEQLSAQRFSKTMEAKEMVQDQSGTGRIPPTTANQQVPHLHASHAQRLCWEYTDKQTTNLDLSTGAV